jgi:Zn-finger nucleic acid-binding protein
VFFDDGELTELRRQGDAALAQLDEAVHPEEGYLASPDRHLRICPGCGSGMSPYRYLYSSPVILDSCEDCGGIWIDNGELKLMQEYIRGEVPGRVVAQVPTVNGDRARIAARAARYLMRRH